MVDMLVDDPDFFAVGTFDPVRNDLYRSVRTVGFANPAAGAAMLVIFVVRHDHFTFEPLLHDQLFAVLGVLLRDDLPRTEKVPSGYRHSDKV